MRYLIAALMILLIACNNKSSTPEITNTDTPAPPPSDPPPGVLMEKADPVLDSILKLPFIVKANQAIDSFTQHKQGIAFLTDTLPESFEIRAGYNGPERFETYYHLSVDRPSLEIKVLDPVEGEYLPLKDFLKKDQ